MSDLGWPLQRAAALHPNATAVIDSERRVSYAELARRVGFLGPNSLAHME